MNQETIQRLVQLNQDFYAQTAQPFNQTRQAAWAGWQRLLPHLPDCPVLRVLDVGCGNGRFGQFLADQLTCKINFTGLDSSQRLLDFARVMLAGRVTGLELVQRDVITHPPQNGAFDVVALFGVLHHVPGWQHRQDFLRTLAERVTPGGVLVFTCWRFYEYERFRQRIAPWPEDYDVEQHDYLLDWRHGTHALRYCHYVDDAEHAQLVAVTGLEEVATFRADGATDDMNRYSVLRRPGDDDKAADL